MEKKRKKKKATCGDDKKEDDKSSRWRKNNGVGNLWKRRKRKKMIRAEDEARLEGKSNLWGLLGKKRIKAEKGEKMKETKGTCPYDDGKRK